MTKEQQEKFALGIGKLVSAFHSLEMALRAYLSNSKPVGNEDSFDLFNLKINDEVLESQISNFDSLSALIKKYNLIANKPTNDIPKQIVDLRDAIAHGRVMSKEAEDIPTLFKFSAPTNKKVTLIVREEMNPEFLGSRLEEIQKFTVKIAKATEEQHE